MVQAIHRARKHARPQHPGGVSARPQGLPRTPHSVLHSDSQLYVSTQFPREIAKTRLRLSSSEVRPHYIRVKKCVFFSLYHSGDNLSQGPRYLSPLIISATVKRHTTTSISYMRPFTPPCPGGATPTLPTTNSPVGLWKLITCTARSSAEATASKGLVGWKQSCDAGPR